MEGRFSVFWAGRPLLAKPPMEKNNSEEQSVNISVVEN
jgi:hypothetical protein